ncbi:hypothetical protein M5K25_017639 [Dendrobium thyrsiflorum]|uniref:Uncharacterized protein n=1 Tax=Dendrobium thyrsiflorum TaxID=117978 RepID=A0ABD0UN97_DENTH
MPPVARASYHQLRPKPGLRFPNGDPDFASSGAHPTSNRRSDSLQAVIVNLPADPPPPAKPSPSTDLTLPSLSTRSLTSMIIEKKNTGGIAERRKRLEAETKEEKLASFPKREEEVEQARKLFQEEETRRFREIDSQQPPHKTANRDKKQPREDHQAAGQPRQEAATGRPTCRGRPGQKQLREDQQAEAINTENSHGKTNSNIPKEQPRGRATGSNTWEANNHPQPRETAQESKGQGAETEQPLQGKEELLLSIDSPL